MAVEYIELQETRGFSDSGGKKTASRTFHVWDDATPITSPSGVRATFGSSLPDIGDLFPDETVVFAVSYSIRHVPEARGVWEVQFNYENTEPSGKLPQEEGYVQITIDYRSEFRDMWRLSPTIPTNGTQNNNDCGGTPIDSAGVPLSVLVRMSDITITETVSAASFPARSLAIRAARGRRNLTTFQGAPIGQVLYQGAQASRIGLEKFSITHKFAQDEFSHMLQSPRRNQTGEVDYGPDAQQNQRATFVRLIQPFPGFADFNLLSENF
ncbi:MAG: hypothetical protein ACK5XN_00765 [Bacteroidota bacterium]